MKTMKFKKKCIILSLILILAGAFLSTVGYGIEGFNYDNLKEDLVEDSWYQTIHINNGNLWYGIELGNNIHLMSIGYVER